MVSDWCVVKTGVSTRYINQFRVWSKKKWPVVDYSGYSKSEYSFTPCIAMIFPKYLGDEVMMRMLNGDFTEETISRDFASENIDK